MQKASQFFIDFNNDSQIRGEYEGNTQSGRAIIFSHGFGMKRDSRGFFTEIGNELSDSFLIIKFDYCKIIPEENATLTYSLSVQTQILQKIIEFIRSKFSIKKLNIIAHSMGCLVVGMAEPEDLNTIILLAPPPSKKIREMQTYFNHKSGTEFHDNKLSKVKRSDGSWTFIHPDFCSEIKLVDPLDLFKRLSNNFKTYFIRALQDDVIQNESYLEIKALKNLNYIELTGDHNFKEPNRRKLIDSIAQILS